MTRYQYRNAAAQDIQAAERQKSTSMPLSIGRRNVYNGEFDAGPVAASPWPDGWELYPNALQTIERTNADSIAGYWSIKGTVDAVGGTAPGSIVQQKLMPVSVLGTYVFRVSTLPSAAGIQCRWGAICYTGPKVLLGTVYAYGPAAPGAGWVRTTANLGVGGTAFVATTKYMRFTFEWTTTTANSFMYVDEIYMEA